MTVNLPTTAAAMLLAVAVATPAMARDQISIVGSSTVFPFSATVAERFGKATEFKTPIVESTGSGGGLKLFCAGVGVDTPDIANSSRRIKDSEVALCAENGVTEIVEAKFGFDGIVIANSVEAPPMQLSLRDLFLALAKNVPNEDGTTQPNPHTMWNEVNPALPAIPIEVLGPPVTSGTRDAFAELAMEAGCETFDWVKELADTDEDAFEALCYTFREDGGFINAGENDNLIVQKLQANTDAVGIFGFSFLAQNRDVIRGATINGVAPEFELISDGTYPIARSLFFYVKAAHVGLVPGIEEFLAEFTAEDTWGEFGYLTDKGLIPLSEDARQEWAAKITGLTPLGR